MVDAKQQEKRQRGDDFQEELRRSWHYVPNCWRMRIADRSGGTRPADEIVLLSNINILAEAKRTAGTDFKLSMIRVNQQKGLYNFDTVIRRNKGLIFISFLNDDIDEAYAFSFIDALRYMRTTGVQYIPLDDFRNRRITCVKLDIMHDSNGDRYYDVKGVEKCYK